MAAEIVSTDKILKLLEKYDFLKIRLLRASDAVYLDQTRPGETAAELQNRFADWINEFITDDNFKEYKLELYGNAEGDTNGKKTLFLKTTIQFNPTPGALIKSAPAMGNVVKDDGFTPREYIELAREKAILEARCAQLEDRILELEDELEDLRENQPTEENKPQGIGEVMNSALMANADKIIGVLCDKLLGSSAPMAIAGVNDTAQADVKYMLYDEMCNIEPSFPAHLEMLYNLRKNSPVIYSIALEKLKGM